MIHQLEAPRTQEQPRTPSPSPVSRDAARVRQLFRESYYPCLRSASCEQRGKTVILRGEVPSFYLKQVAQTLVMEQIPDFARLDNRIRVVTAE